MDILAALTELNRRQTEGGVLFDFEEEPEYLAGLGSFKCNMKVNVEILRFAIPPAGCMTEEYAEEQRQGSLARHKDPVFRANYDLGRKKMVANPVWRENNKVKRGPPSRKFHETDEWKTRQRAAFSKRCTVDGITFYDSRNLLAAALGWGKLGVRSPHFRYQET